MSDDERRRMDNVIWRIMLGVMVEFSRALKEAFLISGLTVK